jgi:GAF domain-containing protein
LAVVYRGLANSEQTAHEQALQEKCTRLEEQLRTEQSVYGLLSETLKHMRRTLAALLRDLANSAFTKTQYQGFWRSAAESDLFQIADVWHRMFFPNKYSVIIRATLYYLDDSTLRPVARWKAGPRADLTTASSWPLKEGVAGKVAASGGMGFFHNVAADEELAHVELIARKAPHHNTIGALLCIPIREHDHAAILGVLAIDANEPLPDWTRFMRDATAHHPTVPVFLFAPEFTQLLLIAPSGALKPQNP